MIYHEGCGGQGMPSWPCPKCGKTLPNPTFKTHNYDENTSTWYMKGTKMPFPGSIEGWWCTVCREFYMIPDTDTEHEEHHIGVTAVLMAREHG